MAPLYRQKLPRPDQGMGKDGRAIADAKLSDIYMEVMLKDLDEADYKRMVFALQLAFWYAFWEECQMITPEIERDFMSARQTCQRATLMLSPEQLETAAFRGKRTVYDWAGPNWRPGS